MHAFQKTLQNIYRHIWINASVLVVLTLMVVIFNFALTLKTSAEKSIEDISTKVDISAELEKDLEKFEIEVLVGDLKHLPEVESVEVIRSEEAEEIFLELHPEVSEFLEEDFLPSSLSIIASKAGDQEKIIEFLKTRPNYIKTSTIESSSEENNPVLSISASAAEELGRLVDAANSLFAGVAFVLTISILVITLNAIYISLFSRREEIAIMRLVGASYSRIRRPYIYEGILISLSSVFLGDLLFIVLINMSGWTEVFALLPLGIIVLFQLLIAIIGAALASLIASNIFLKKQNLNL